MLVHLLSGFTGGLSNVFFSLSLRGVLLLGLGMLVVWEVAEYALGVRESASNRIIDIIVGFVGIVAALWIAARIARGTELIAFFVSLCVTSALATAGWLAYRRRVLEQRSAA
jgi:hypothetical protein